MESSAIKLSPLSIHNWEKCAKLKVKQNQEDNLPPNLFSIAELNFYPKTKAFVIELEEETIGFVTFGVIEENKKSKIFRLMIDGAYQGKGYGTIALTQLSQFIFDTLNSEEIHVCYNPDKAALSHFYQSVGFKEIEIQPSKFRKEGKMLAILNKKDFQQSI